MGVSGGYKFDAKFRANFDDELVDVVLFWDGVPLEFSVEPIAEDVLKLACKFSHRV